MKGVLLAVLVIVGLAGEPQPTTYTVCLPMVLRTYTPVASKKGVAASYPTCSDVERVNVSWFYEWGNDPPRCAGVEAVPMLWDGSYIGRPIGGSSPYLLGFNEPDLEQQANLAPERAATLWREVERRYPLMKLVAPVPSSIHPLWLVDWYESYTAQYGQPPKVDALATHCYSFYSSECLALFRWFVAQAHAWGVPEVWVTEWAMLPCGPHTVQQALGEMQAVRSYLEAEPTITRYAWFATTYEGSEWFWNAPQCNTSLIGWYTHALTPFGEAYD